LQAEADAERRLVLAEHTAEAAGAACRIEVALARAKLLTDQARRRDAEALFDRVEDWLA
jgi:hypothetical protein